jgi:hypothetical protein
VNHLAEVSTHPNPLSCTIEAPHATSSYQRRRRVGATSTPDGKSSRLALRISTGPVNTSVARQGWLSSPAEHNLAC